MQTMSIHNLLKNTTCVLLNSTTADGTIVHSVGLTIEMKEPMIHPTVNEFHIHLDLCKTIDNKIMIENKTPPQMLGNKFWHWLEIAAPEEFFLRYISSIYDQVQQQSIEKFMH